MSAEAAGVAGAHRGDAAGQEAAAQHRVLQENSAAGQADGDEEEGEQLLLLSTRPHRGFAISAMFLSTDETLMVFSSRRWSRWR